MKQKDCRFCCAMMKSTDHYMVKDFVWNVEAKLSRTDVAHLQCLESHLHRALSANDFTDAVINYCGAVQQHKLPQKNFSYLASVRFDDKKIEKLTKSCVF